MAPEDIHLEAVHGIKEMPSLPIINMLSKTVVIHKE